MLFAHWTCSNMVWLYFSIQEEEEGAPAEGEAPPAEVPPTEGEAPPAEGQPPTEGAPAEGVPPAEGG